MRVRNPFGPAVEAISDQIEEISWEFQYIHAAISILALIVVAAALMVLYPTVGVILQIADIWGFSRGFLQENEGRL